MIDMNKIRRAVITGLRDYLKIAVIRSNQTGEPPEYPYLSYTITTLMSENNGSYGDYEDGVKRKPFTQTWSITVQSADDAEAMYCIIAAKNWLEQYGRTYLSDNGVIIQSVGAISNRDNMLTIEYEYRKGFDFVLSLMDEVGEPTEYIGVIESVEVGNALIEPEPTEEELNAMLEARLDGDA